MTLATTRAGLTYPVQADNNDVATHMQTLAQNVDDAMAMCAQGLIASRPVAGKVRRLYWATDDRGGKLSYDDGTTWRDIGPSPVTGPATGYTGLIVSAPSAALADTTLIVRGKASQTGPLLQVQDSGSINKLVVASDGSVGIGGVSTTKGLIVASTNYSSNATTTPSYGPVSVLNLTPNTVPYIAMFNSTPGKAMAWGLDGGGNAVLGSADATGAFISQRLVVSYTATPSPSPGMTLNTGDIMAAAGGVKAQGVGGVPKFYWKATDSVADAKVWDMVAVGNTLLGRAVSDSELASTTWLTVTRAATAISSVALAGHLILTGDTGTSLATGALSAGLAMWGSGIVYTADSLAPQGGVTAGIAVAINRAAPALTVTNGSGDTLQLYGAGYALREQHRLDGTVTQNVNAGGGISANGLEVYCSPNTGGWAALYVHSNWGGGGGGNLIRTANSVGDLFCSDAYGRLTFGQGSVSAGIFGTTASAGGASALPAAPVGYMQINVNGTTYKIPYYGV